METDRGTGPASSASLAPLAHDNDRSTEAPSLVLGSAAFEITRGELHAIPFDPIEDGDAEAIEIEKEFRRRLTGLRRLPRSARAVALREARDWRLVALKALREKHARERQANVALWRQRSLASRPLGPG